jgi:hypothetical protein
LEGVEAAAEILVVMDSTQWTAAGVEMGVLL